MAHTSKQDNVEKSTKSQTVETAVGTSAYQYHIDTGKR